MKYTKEDLYIIQSNIKDMERKLGAKLGEENLTLDWMRIEDNKATIQFCLSEDRMDLWTHEVVFSVDKLNQEGGILNIIREKRDWHTRTLSLRIEHQMSKEIEGQSKSRGGRTEQRDTSHLNKYL